MSRALNSPERVRQGLDSVHDRIDAVDRELGEERTALFASEIASLLRHIEPDLDGLASAVSVRRQQAHVVTGLIHAATEFETGWNNIRLANAPASQRQGRVAAEFVAAAVLQAVPEHVLERLPATDHVRRLLREYPGASVAGLMTPSISEDGDSIVPARLLSMHAYRSFLSLVATFPSVSDEDVDVLKEYRKSVQNSASHGSAELIGYHFEGAKPDGDMRGGAYFDAGRGDTYRRASDDLIGLVQVMTRFLNATVEVVRADAAA